MRFDNLSDWLQWQENLHFTDVDPGLERIGQVWGKLGSTHPLPFKVVTVAGTNGKGSSVAMLGSILTEAGYTVGAYTSPHILAYNERITLNGKSCSDEEICNAFHRIDEARGEVSLTYFEFATLAAALIFLDNDVDVALFEVGMGGRLDAVNLFDADIALITPIGLDHVQWLGTDREQIGREKAGIIRPQQDVVCSESQPPKSLIDYANSLGAKLFILDSAFSYRDEQSYWLWQNDDTMHEQLARPALVGKYQLQNAAAVIQVIELLASRGISTTKQHISNGLAKVKLAGRFQQLQTEHGQLVLDVTHNQQGALNLAAVLTEQPCEGRTFVLLAMLADKDVHKLVEPLQGLVDHWFIAGLTTARGMSADVLSQQVSELIAVSNIDSRNTVEEAYDLAKSVVTSADRLIVLGSFHTVEAVIKIRVNYLD